MRKNQIIINQTIDQLLPKQHKLVGQPLSNVGQSLVNRCPINLCCSGTHSIVNSFSFPKMSNKLSNVRLMKKTDKCNIWTSFLKSKR